MTKHLHFGLVRLKGIVPEVVGSYVIVRVSKDQTIFYYVVKHKTLEMEVYFLFHILACSL